MTITLQTPATKTINVALAPIETLATETFAAAAETAEAAGFIYGQAESIDADGSLIVRSLILNPHPTSPVSFYVDDAFGVIARDNRTGATRPMPQDGEPGYVLLQHVLQGLATYTVASGFATELAQGAHGATGI